MGSFNLAVFSVVKHDGETSVAGKATLYAGGYFTARAVPHTNNLHPVHAWKAGKNQCSCTELDFDCPINTTRVYRIPEGQAVEGPYSIGVSQAEELQGKNGTLNVGSETGDPAPLR